MTIKKKRMSIVLFLLFGLFLFLFVTDVFSFSSGHKFLFRKVYGDDISVCNERETIPQLTPLIQTGAKVHGGNFFYIPDKDLYVVKAFTEFPEEFDIESESLESPETIWRHLLLDAEGEIIKILDSDMVAGFSRHSGMFFSHDFYIDWFNTKSSGKQIYKDVVNADMGMSSQEFRSALVQRYERAEYVEFINLRPAYPAGGVAFKIDGEWTLLISGHHDLWNRMVEDLNTGISEAVYELKNDGDGKYVQSPPLLDIIPLESDAQNYSLFYNYPWKRKLKIDKFEKASSEPPLTIQGTAYISLTSGKGKFKFKIPHVVKYWFWPMYDLSVRTLKVPTQADQLLEFVEVTQMQGGEGQFREGVGIYVVQEKICNEHVFFSDLPAGISEERFSKLPIKIQRGLMQPAEITTLKITDEINEWLPEIELFENLQYLNLERSGVIDIPDGIGSLSKLRVLNLSLNSVSGFNVLENGRVEIYAVKGVQLPPSFKNLQQLRKVYMSFAGLFEFPSELFSLPELREIDIAHNPISEIPEGIGNLKKLERLDLEGTKVTSLPESMASMRNLRVTGLSKEKFPEKFHHLFTQR